MELTLTTGDILECSNNSTANELFFEYNKASFSELLDLLKDYNNIDGAILELKDGDDNVLRTDCITFKRVSTVEINDDVVKFSLVTINALERDILKMQDSLEDIENALEEIMLILTDLE